MKRNTNRDLLIKCKSVFMFCSPAHASESLIELILLLMNFDS